jgi:hypothetical protein
MLDLDDIQHILLTRAPAMTGRYEFLSFDDPAGGRAWLTELLDRVQSAADAQATMDSSRSCSRAATTNIGGAPKYTTRWSAGATGYGSCRSST